MVMVDIAHHGDGGHAGSPEHDGVGRRGHGQHEGVAAAQGCRQHEVERVHSDADALSTGERVGTRLTHICPPLRSTFAVRETASLGIMGAPRVPHYKQI